MDLTFLAPAATPLEVMPNPSVMVEADAAAIRANRGFRTAPPTERGSQIASESFKPPWDPEHTATPGAALLYVSIQELLSASSVEDMWSAVRRFENRH
jgi:hypothetical protein